MGRPIKAEQIQLTIPRRCCILLPKQLAPPRKGTVTLQRQRRCPSRQRQLTPRKGTRNPDLRWSRRPCKKQLTPRKGTRTGCSCLPCRSRFETTYTPQGDGNRPSAMRSHSSRKQLTPRKGTVTRQRQRRCPSRQRYLHTPQGDDPLERRDPHEPANRTSHLRLSAP